MQAKNIKTYPLSNGKYIVSFMDTVRKKRVLKSFDQETEANNFLSKIKGQAPAKGDLEFLKTTSVETALKTYFERMPGSYLSKSPKLVREFLEFFSAHGVPRLSEDDLRSFLTQIKNENDYSDRSMLRVKSSLEGFFKFLIANDAMTNSPLEYIKFNRGAPFKRKPILFDDSEFQNFIARAKNLSPVYFFPIFLLIYETAAKTSDIINLQWKDIHYKNQSIELTRSQELQNRSFTVSEELLTAIGRNPRLNDFVFTTLEGRQLKKHHLGRELKKFQRLAHFDTAWGLRDLRTSYGINFLNRGGSVKDLQKIMGHVRPYQTKEIYGCYNTVKIDLADTAAVQGTGGVSSSDRGFLELSRILEN